MPDDPIDMTDNLGLGQWGDKAKPGFEALNDNWQKIDDAIGALVASLEAIDVSGKADQADLEAVSADLVALEDAVTAAVYIKADGTVPMAADLDFDGFKATNLGNGSAPADGVNKGQLDAAVAAAISAGINAALGSVGYNFYRHHARRLIEGTGANVWDHRAGSSDLSNGTPSTFSEPGGVFQKWTSGGSSGNLMGTGASGSPAATRADRNLIFHAKFKTGSNISSLRFFIGFAYGSGSVVQSAAWNTVGAMNSMGFGFDSSMDANHWVTNLQSIAAVDVHVTSIPIAADTVYYLKMDASTYSVDGTIKFYINGVLAASRTPGTALSGTQDMDPHFMGVNLTGSSRHYYVGPQHFEQDAEGAIDLVTLQGDFRSDGSIPMTGDLDLGGNKAINSGTATDPDDLVPLGQVEDMVQVVQDAVDAITAGQLQVLETEATGGDQSVSGTSSWTVITGTAIVFTLDETKKVAIDAHATFSVDALRRANSQIGIKVQKTGDSAVTYPGTFVDSQTLGNGSAIGLCVAKKLPLAAGEWTVTIVAKQIRELGATTKILKNADSPARLGVVYTG